MAFEGENSEIFDLTITPYARSLFLNMARWAKFLAISGFILMGLMSIVFMVAFYTSSQVSSNTMFSSFGIVGGSIFTLFILAVYFYPTYALLMYSIKVKRALTSINQHEFDGSINFLKNMFMYIGILLIIFMVLYGAGLAVAIAGIAARS